MPDLAALALVFGLGFALGFAVGYGIPAFMTVRRRRRYME
jgi:uncharacterized membrane protein (Fun14 family)